MVWGRSIDTAPRRGYCKSLLKQINRTGAQSCFHIADLVTCCGFSERSPAPIVAVAALARSRAPKASEIMNDHSAGHAELPRSAYLDHTLRRAWNAAQQRSHRYVTLEHLLLALLDDPDATELLQAVDADISDYPRLGGHRDKQQRGPGGSRRHSLRPSATNSTIYLPARSSTPCAPGAKKSMAPFCLLRWQNTPRATPRRYWPRMALMRRQRSARLTRSSVLRRKPPAASQTPPPRPPGPRRRQSPNRMLSALKLRRVPQPPPIPS